MAKSVFTSEYETFLKLLRAAREKAGITQVQVAQKLELTQSAVSKIERGERRLDVVELRRWCQAIGISLSKFARDLEKALD